MADEIKIRVGIQNNVKPGMDAVVRDVENSAKSMRGKGFMEAFSKAIRGDISGALEDLSARMGKGFGGLAGKAALWGGGIATALMAGWKAGTKLDQMFGISDKIAAAWTKSADQIGQKWDAFYKRLRKARMDAEHEAKVAFETDQKRFDIREKSRLKRMTPQERVDYAEEGVRSARAASEARAITPDERGRRRVVLEEQEAEYQDAVDARNAANEKAEEEKRAAAQKTADAEQAELRKAQDALYDAVREERAQAVGAAREKQAADEKANKEKLAGLAAEMKRLDDVIAKERERAEAAQAGIDVAADPGAWRGAQSAGKLRDREEARRKRIEENWEANAARGTKAPPRIQAWLDEKKAKDDAEAKAQAAAQALRGAQAAKDKLEKEAAEAAVKAEATLAKLLDLQEATFKG